jgi:hypothetical protein
MIGRGSRGAQQLRALLGIDLREPPGSRGYGAG